MFVLSSWNCVVVQNVFGLKNTWRFWLIWFYLTYGAFNSILQFYRGDQFYWQEKTIDLSQVTDKLYHILYRVHLAWAMFEITTLVVIGTGCIANYKSNYHTITFTTASKKDYYTPLISNIHLWKQTFALFLQSLNFKLGTSTDSEISIEEFNTQTLTIDYIDNVNLTTISSQKYLEMKSWSFLFDN